MAISHEEITLQNSNRIQKISDAVALMESDIKIIKNDIVSLKTSNDKINTQIERVVGCVTEQSIFIENYKRNSEKTKNIVMWTISNINNVIILVALVYIILFATDFSIFDLLGQ